MDSDKDGQISADHIDISELSNDIIDIITPLLLKIEKEKLHLDISEFEKLISKFVEKLNVDSRNKLIGPKRDLK